MNRSFRPDKGHGSFRPWILAFVIGLTLVLRHDCAGCRSIYDLAAQEYIIVRVKDQPSTRAAVLINGVKSVLTGELITLGSPGRIYISVDLPKARQRKVDVTNTTPIHPMIIEIDCQ